MCEETEAVESIFERKYFRNDEKITFIHKGVNPRVMIRLIVRNQRMYRRMDTLTVLRRPVF